MGKPQDTNLTRRRINEDISILKATAVVYCLKAKPIRENLKLYFPVIAKKFNLRESAVRHIWLHRNWVITEWNQNVPVTEQSTFENRLFCFLQEWICKSVSKVKLAHIDYSKASESSNNENHYNFNEFKITSWMAVCTRLESQSKELNSSGSRHEKIERLLQSFLKVKVKKQGKGSNPAGVLCTKIHTQDSQIISRVGFDTSIIPNRLNGNTYASCAYVKAKVYERIFLYSKRFFISPEIVAKVALQVINKHTSTVQWPKYLRSYIKTTRFYKRFIKQYSLIKMADSSHPVFPMDCIFRTAIVKLVRLENSPVQEVDTYVHCGPNPKAGKSMSTLRATFKNTAYGMVIGNAKKKKPTNCSPEGSKYKSKADTSGNKADAVGKSRSDIVTKRQQKTQKKNVAIRKTREKISTNPQRQEFGQSAEERQQCTVNCGSSRSSACSSSELSKRHSESITSRSTSMESLDMTNAITQNCRLICRDTDEISWISDIVSESVLGDITEDKCLELEPLLNTVLSDDPEKGFKEETDEWIEDAFETVNVNVHESWNDLLANPEAFMRTANMTSLTESYSKLKFELFQK